MRGGADVLDLTFSIYSDMFQSLDSWTAKVYKDVISESEIFLKNEELLEYLELVVRPDAVGEKHHILPKSIFPQYLKSKWNMVLLSGSNHRRAHGLLTKIISSKFPDHQDKMFIAYGFMREAGLNDSLSEAHRDACRRRQLENNSFKGKTHSDEYKERLRLQMTGSGNPFYGKQHTKETRDAQSKRCRDTFLGRKQTPQHSEKIAAARRGVKFSEERCQKMQEIMLGREITPEWRANISKGLKSAPRVTCPHCGKVGAGNNMTRYHFVNCKFKTTATSAPSGS